MIDGEHVNSAPGTGLSEPNDLTRAFRRSIDKHYNDVVVLKRIRNLLRTAAVRFIR